MQGMIYPRDDRYKARLEKFQAEAKAALEEQKTESEIQEHTQSLGYNLTPYEVAVVERANKIAAVERAEEERRATFEKQIAAIASAGPFDEKEGEDDVNVSGDEGSTHSDSANGHHSTHSTPAKKRFKPHQSPVPRSPEALREAMELDDDPPAPMMDVNAELRPDDLLPDVFPPQVANTHFGSSSCYLQEEVETSKQRVFVAGFMHGDTRGLEVKREEMDRLSSLQPAPQPVDNAAASPPQPPVNVTPKVVAVPQPKPKPKPTKQVPAMSKEEMQTLYMQVRRKPLQWKPDEDGHFQVVVFNEPKPIKIDGTVPKGSGKTCQHSLGVRHPTAVLKWMMQDGDEVIEVPGVPQEKLHTPQVFHNLPMDQLVSIQSLSRDYVPSKKSFAVAPYLDSKIVKFDKPRNRAPFEWIIVETKATSTVTVPVRAWDCDYYLDIGAKLRGAYPEAFVEYCLVMDEQLIGVQNKSIASGDNFFYLNELKLLNPTPVDALLTWEQHSASTIEDVIGRQAAKEIVDEEEAPHCKGKKNPKTVKVPRRVYDDVVRCLPPKRKLVAEMGSLLLGKTFELPMVPLNIGIEEPKNKPAASETQKKVGRQPGELKRAAPPTSTRATRGSAPPPPPPRHLHHLNPRLPRATKASTVQPTQLPGQCKGDSQCRSTAILCQIISYICSNKLNH